MHVRFATPTASGTPCPEYLDSMEKTVRALEDVGWGTSLDLVKNDVYVQRARNSLVASFLASTATYLFFIDDDVIWPAEAIIHILANPKTVKCGVYCFKNDVEDYPIVIATHPETHQPMGHKGWIDTAGAPAGFLCIHRSAIELLVKSYPDLAYDDYDRSGKHLGIVYDLFPQGVRDRRWWGEDYGFCNLWRDIGGHIWCWPDIDLGHRDRKTGKIYWGNYDKFLRAEKTAA